MGKMIQAAVRENEYQVTIQAVFSKPENLSRSAFYIDETIGQHDLDTERSSTFSSMMNSDGSCASVWQRDVHVHRFLFIVDELPRKRGQLKKTKKKARKRPQSASASGRESVR